MRERRGTTDPPADLTQHPCYNHLEPPGSGRGGFFVLDRLLSHRAEGEVSSDLQDFDIDAFIASAARD